MISGREKGYLKVEILESDMTFELKEHEADMGIVGIGSTVEEAFQEGARAMFSIMINLDKIVPTKFIEISCEADSIDILFVEFLNKLLAEINMSEMFFSKFEVKIEKTKPNAQRPTPNALEKYILTGKAYGEPIDKEKHQAKVEVKAATYHGLKYEEKEGKHYIQCVVDV